MNDDLQELWQKRFDSEQTSMPNHEDEFLLAFFPKANVSPVTNVTSHSSSLLAFGESSENIETIHFEAMASFSV